MIWKCVNKNLSKAYTLINISESVSGSAYFCDDISGKSMQPIPCKLLHITWMAIAKKLLHLQFQQIQYGRLAAILLKIIFSTLQIG